MSFHLLRVSRGLPVKKRYTRHAVGSALPWFPLDGEEASGAREGSANGTGSRSVTGFPGTGAGAFGEGGGKKERAGIGVGVDGDGVPDEGEKG